MIAEMWASVPNYSSLLARTHLQNAWTDVRNMGGWSFQLGNGGFGTPGLTNAGSVTCTFGSPTVTGDAQASAAWVIASQPGSLITQQQFRVGAGTIYNIIGADFTNPNAAVLTLDRPFFDTSATVSGSSGLGYSVYQCYFPVPVEDFLAWESVVDINNAIDLCAGTAKRYRDLADAFDPQRQIFSNPGTLIPYQVDARVGSSTFGWMMYELYPQPQSQFAYQTWYTRSGAPLVNPSDTLPFPITEHVIKTLARVKAYEWAEANKNVANPKGSAPDFRFLMGAAAKEGADQLKELRDLDRNRVDMWWTVMSRVQGYGYPATFNPSTGKVIANNIW